jgi:hypothetical protein
MAAVAADTFEERARELVAFLVERHGAFGAARVREQELADWIARRRKAGSPAHFVAPELGIILRALSGPDPAATRPQDPGHQQMCWLIAQRMSHEEAR